MAPHLLAHSFYMQNLTFGAFVGSVNPVAWSLEIEVQFYVLFPLPSLMFSIGDARLRRIAILPGMLITSLLRIPLHRSMPLHYSILYYCPFFLACFLLCDLYLTRGEWRTSFIWDAAICLWPFVWLIAGMSVMSCCLF
jgi:peptidoglycan/LPS O-acetylase OafA/YrhL